MTNFMVRKLTVAAGSFAMGCVLTLSATSVSAAAIGNPSSSNGWDTTSVVSVTASSEDSAPRGAINTINGSGISSGGDLHGNVHTQMWLSGNAAAPYWIKFDLGSVHALDEMHIWNYNELNWPFVGMQDVIIEYSDDDVSWSPLASLKIQMAQEGGAAAGAVDAIVPFNGITARYVMISSDPNGEDNWSNIHEYVGLGEVRFYDVPEPASLMLIGAGGLAVCRRRCR